VDPGCFNLDPGSGSQHFSIPDLGYGSQVLTFFFPDPGSYIKRGMTNKNYLFSFSGVSFRRQKDNLSWIRIPDPDPGSDKYLSRIRISDPQGKKAPDPGSGSVTLGGGTKSLINFVSMLAHVAASIPITERSRSKCRS
jgi:hypothetical protein